MKNVFAMMLLFVFISCTKFTVSNTIENFAGNRWEKENIKTFDFEIKDDINADISIFFSHVNDPQYDKVPLEVTIQSPSGKKDKMAVMLRLKDESGKDLSDCVGDICDLSTVIKEAMPLNRGKYIITLQNTFSQHEYIPNVLALGVSINAVSH